MKSHKQLKPLLQKLGETIYQHRVSRNFPTKKIAHMISLTPEAFRKIEKGESDLSFTTFFLITKILEIDCAQLIKKLELEELFIAKD